MEEIKPGFGGGQMGGDLTLWWRPLSGGAAGGGVVTWVVSSLGWGHQLCYY